MYVSPLTEDFREEQIREPATTLKRGSSVQSRLLEVTERLQSRLNVFKATTLDKYTLGCLENINPSGPIVLQQRISLSVVYLSSSTTRQHAYRRIMIDLAPTPSVRTKYENRT